MTPETIIILCYLCFTLIQLYLSLSLSMLNLGNIHRFKKKPPQALEGIMTKKQYKKSQRYSISKEGFAIFSTLFGTAFTLTLIFTGALGSLDILVSKWFAGPFWQGFIYLSLLSVISSIVNFPLGFYRQFVLEEEFGFNRMTLGLYIGDALKQALLSTLLTLPLLALLYWFLDKTGDLWWLYGWGLFIAFQLLLYFIYPVLIAPLFNKFTPLEEGELKNSLTALADKAGFAHQGIFMMDGSKRSSHSNAYFTGIGKFRRIVLFDTLVEQMTIKELEAVLAHEIGHFKKKHILKRMVTTLLVLGAGFYLLHLAMDWAPLYSAFKFSKGSVHAILVILAYLSSPFSFLLTPLSSSRSRKHEFQADRYSKELIGSPEPLVEGLIKLNCKNLSNLTPHPLYSNFYYSHPTLLERRAALLGAGESEEQEG